MSKTFSFEGIVLRRSNTGETDRIVSILSPQYGKLVCVAKGVRKLNSSTRASLEPGNIVRAFVIKTKSMPLLTQSKLIDTAISKKPSLKQFRQLSQLLEILENILVEEEIEPRIFRHILNIRTLVLAAKTNSTQIQRAFEELFPMLGFASPKEAGFVSVSAYVNEISNKKIKSFEYLKV